MYLITGCGSIKQRILDSESCRDTQGGEQREVFLSKSIGLIDRVNINDVGPSPKIDPKITKG
jgi:hypothetical protein